jgi:hypothetical protein
MAASTRKKDTMKALGLVTAIAKLVVNSDLWKTHELWRAAWSANPRAATWHMPIRLHGGEGVRYAQRLMCVNNGDRYLACELTAADALSQDWEVRPWKK